MDENASEQSQSHQQDKRVWLAKNLAREDVNQMHLVELSRQEHSGLKINPGLAEASAARQHLIPIVVSEFRKAAIQYPIVFAKNPETGRFGAYVLNGLEPEENLFWSGTTLDVAYVPLNIRRRPFFVGMANAAAGAKDNVLCIDIESPCLTA